MQVRLHNDATAFLAAAGPLLRSDPFSTNVIAVASAHLTAGAGCGDRLWATVDTVDRSVVGVAMLAPPPRPLFLSRMPPDAAAAIAGALADAGVDLAGVNGACGSTASFAQAWLARTGHASVVATAMRMYRLHGLRAPSGVPGGPAVPAGPDEVDLVAGWLGAFHDEARPNTAHEDWVALARQRVAAGQLHLWHDDGSPVALAGRSRPAAGVARIGPVYTPPGSRRRGYGAAVTAAVSAAALADGADHIVLYADLGNPTSNSVYQAIGYRPDHDADERRFQ